MNIKVLSIEEWNLHPAVEVPFPENKKDAPMYRLEAGWYHGDLGTFVFRLKLGVIVSTDATEV